MIVGSVGLLMSIVKDNFAMFFGGLSPTSASVSTTTERYMLVSNTVTTRTAIATARWRGSGMGTRIAGYYSGGSTATATTPTAANEKYTYSTDGVANSTSLTEVKAFHSAAGNDTIGLMANGQNATVGVYTSTKYTYSGESMVAGTNMGNTSFVLSASGISAYRVSLHNIGYDKYVYSSDTRTLPVTFNLSFYSGCAIGSLTFGIFQISTNPFTTATEKYAYATDTKSSGTALPSTRGTASGASDTVKGIIAQGTGDFAGTIMLKSSVIYTFSGESVVAGTDFSADRTGAGAVGNGHSGLT